MACWYRMLAAFRGAPGLEQDWFGRCLGVQLLLRGERHLGIPLLLSPVKIVRYFEFDFAARVHRWRLSKKVLDVSSPRLFSLWVASHFKQLDVAHINPDKNDTAETQALLGTRLDRGNLKLSNEDATVLSFGNNTFDAVISLSVLEHIPADGDKKALAEMWRVLRPGGRLILTVPFLPEYREEYFDFDEYHLYAPGTDGRYFASRYYDEVAVNSRIIDVVGRRPEVLEIFGERERGTFFAYREREWRAGIEEAVKDPYHIAADYRRFDTFKSIPGLAVIGMVFAKP